MDELKKRIQHRLITDYDILFQENINEERVKYYIEKVVETLPSKERELFKYPL